jgi:hypothetical protein
MNKIKKITLAISAILLCLSTTGCYEVINKFKGMFEGDKYCVVSQRGGGSMSCYYLDENLSAKQCEQLATTTDMIAYTTSKRPSYGQVSVECWKYKD